MASLIIYNNVWYCVRTKVKGRVLKIKVQKMKMKRIFQ